MLQLKSFLRDESGATALEYGVLSGLIGAMIISGLQMVGTKLSGQFTVIAANLN
jgi:pilus assembly protein Flp/PilA